MANDPKSRSLHWLTAAVVKTGLVSNLPRSRILSAVPPGTATAEAWDLAANAFGLSQEQLARIVGAAYGLPVANTRFIEPEAAGFLPEDVARQLAVVPIRHTEATIVIATASPIASGVEGRVQALAGRRTMLSVASPVAISAAQDLVYGDKEPADFILTRLRLEAAMQRVELPAAAQTLPSRAGAVDRLIRLILFEAAKARATLIDLEPKQRGGRVSFVVDGERRTVVFFPVAVILRIMARIRNWARAGLLDPHGRMGVRVDGDRYVLRLRLEGTEALDPIRIDVSPAGAPAPVPAPEAASARPAQPLALVVDDEPGDRFLLKTMLKRSGFAIVEAQDGIEAMTRLQGPWDFDVVLLDLMMPRMSGLEVLTRMRETVRTAGMPVIVVTASEDPDDRRKLLAAGADDYLQKPIDPPRIAERVRALLLRSAPVG